MGWDWVGWDLCAGLFYEHRFAMLISEYDSTKNIKMKDFEELGNLSEEFAEKIKVKEKSRPVGEH